MGIRGDKKFLRGLKKVEIEWGILFIAHNLQKLAVIGLPVFFISFDCLLTFLDSPMFVAE